MALYVIARWLYLNIEYQCGLGELVLHPTGLVGTVDTFIVLLYLWRTFCLPFFERVLGLQVGIAEGKGFLIEVGNGDDVDGNVLVVVLIMLRLWHFKLMIASADDGIAEHNLLHRLLRFDPRTASQCKAITDMDTHAKSKTVGLCEGAVCHLPEVLTHGIGLTLVFWVLCCPADGHQVATSQADVFHSLQVGFDTLF